jgi:hypothetical protein
MRRLAAAFVAVGALVAAGCGSTSSARDFAGAEQAIAEKVEQLQSAGESRDGDEICTEVVSRALRQALTAPGSTCPEQVDEALGDADDFELDVRDVTIRGERATAQVRARVGGAERLRAVELVRQGGGWRVDSLG